MYIVSDNQIEAIGSGVAIVDKVVKHWFYIHRIEVREEWNELILGPWSICITVAPKDAKEEFKFNLLGGKKGLSDYVLDNYEAFITED